jgi:nitrogen regulatory protein PII-like uncharacterized protein
LSKDGKVNSGEGAVAVDDAARVVVVGGVVVENRVLRAMEAVEELLAEEGAEGIRPPPRQPDDPEATVTEAL